MADRVCVTVINRGSIYSTVYYDRKYYTVPTSELQYSMYKWWIDTSHMTLDLN